MIDINNIINAANYERLCDFSIIPQQGLFFNDSFLEKDGNIFCKTDYIDYLFENLRLSTKQYNLITHHSDYPIDESRIINKPSCIKKWYAINLTVEHPDLTAIPLGVKTHQGAFYEPQYMTEWFANNIEGLKSTNKEYNVYCNWNNTNIERNKIIEKLKDNNIVYTHAYNMPFNEYIEKMAQHKFVISPPGNGIDCHRTWEALYIGCVPIVIKNNIYKQWKDLPIIQVNDYSEVTNDLLSQYLNSNFDCNTLNIDYWKSIIN
jgi:hypothetical protein